MKNHWLILNLLNDINTTLKEHCIQANGFIDAFLEANEIVIDCVKNIYPSFKVSSEYKRLTLCYSNSKGFFVEFSEN